MYNMNCKWARVGNPSSWLQPAEVGWLPFPLPLPLELEGIFRQRKADLAPHSHTPYSWAAGVALLVQAPHACNGLILIYLH